jgi:hypothetical protein
MVSEHKYYTVHEYVALPGDVVMYHAYDPLTGIGCPGRETFDLALQDAQALNAAIKAADDWMSWSGTKDRAQAWESITKLLRELDPKWYGCANTGEQAALAAIRRWHAEAQAAKAPKRPWWRRWLP